MSRSRRTQPSMMDEIGINGPDLEVAGKILAYVDSPALKSHPVAACVETVQVVATERY